MNTLFTFTSSLKAGAKVFWKDKDKNYLSKDQLAAAFLGFCMCAPFFGLSFLIFSTQHDGDLEGIKAIICFLCYILCNAIIPVFSMRNAVNTTEKKPIEDLLRGSTFLQVYLQYLKRKSFLPQVIFNALGVFFVFYLFHIRYIENLRCNIIFIDFFSRSIA